MNQRNKKITLCILTSLLLIFGGLYYWSPLQWNLRPPRTYEECWNSGGTYAREDMDYVNEEGGHVSVDNWYANCHFEGKIFTSPLKDK